MTRASLSFLAILALSLPAHADYSPPSYYSLTYGAVLTGGGALIHSGRCTIGGATHYNSSSSGTSYLEIFDATTQPATGTDPVWQSPSCAFATLCQFTAPSGGIQLTTGAWVALSSTGPNFTAATVSGWYGVASK